MGDAARVRPIAASAGDDAVTEATGRPWREWHALLGAAGATAWSHAEIARWLACEHAVAGWWAQNLTVRFEQENGTRQPGQRPDGTFEASVSRTLALDPSDALDAAIARLSALGQAAAVNREAKHPNARWLLDDGGRIHAMASPRGPGKTSLVLTHSKLADSEQAVAAKAQLRKWLAGAR